MEKEKLMADSYEESLEKIQEIVQKLESGELPLEESIDAYSEGLKLLKDCYDRLNKAEKKLEQLSKSLDNITAEETELE